MRASLPLDIWQTALIDLGKAAVQSEWPLIVGATLYYLRDELKDAAGSLEEITIAGQTAKFRRRLNKAAALAPGLPPVAADARQDDRPKLAFDAAPEAVVEKAKDRTSEAALMLPPPYVVMTAWKDLETALYRVAGKETQRGLDILSPGPSLEQIASDLQLPTTTIEFLSELRNLRNQAAHGKADDISVTDALRYRDLADQLIAHLNSRRPRRVLEK